MTRREAVVYACGCGERFRAEVWRAVDARDRDLERRLCDGSLNHVACPACGTVAEVQVPVVYHQPGARLVLVLPDGLRHRELGERAAWYAALAADHEAPPAYVLAGEVVFTAAGLRALLAAEPHWTEAVARHLATEHDLAAHHLVAEHDLGSHGDDEAPGPSTAPAAGHVAEAGEGLDLPITIVAEEAGADEAPPARAAAGALVIEATGRRREDDTDRVARQRREEAEAAQEASGDAEAALPGHRAALMAVPDPRAAVIERWIAGREGPAAFLVDDRVLLCAALQPAHLEAFVPGEIALRVQLHRLPTYPLLALTLLAAEGQAGRPDDSRVLSVPLDVARAAHRVVLEALGRRAALSLELYDSEYLPVIAHSVAAPLEENVRRLVADARDALDRLPPITRSFDRARQQFIVSGYERVGRAPVDLPPAEAPLAEPSAVRAALQAVARWSEPNGESYLVEVCSLALPEWRRRRAHVVERALDAGIAVPRALWERVAKESDTPTARWPEVLAQAVKRFTELGARLKPSDLAPDAEAENWEALLREAALAGVGIDDQVRKLAHAAIARTRAETPTPMDLQALAVTDLAPLLEHKELRQEAALALCHRGEVEALPALFAALPRLTRAEANLVLPALTAFGDAAEPWLLETLKSRKSYMRQGAALALARLRSPQAVTALVSHLVSEPTEIWSEVARALGDLGPVAVAPLVATLGAIDDDGRDRVVQALAQVVARTESAGAADPGRALVAELAVGRDARVAETAQLALARVAEVRADDERVRASGPEVTVVRGFSRRFYEALAGGSGAAPFELAAPGDEVGARGTSPARGEGPQPASKSSLPRPGE